MKRIPILLSTAAALTLTACVTVPPTLNAKGQPIKFAEPILGPAERDNGIYVLLEKSIADGKYKVANVSRTRQPIANERQERVAFNSDLTRYAPDFTAAGFYTYADPGNYGEKTVITNCQGRAMKKTLEYSPCSSAFSYVFVPTSVTKSYVAGSMGYETHKRWEDPRFNLLRGVDSPRAALRQAGVFEHLDQLVSAK
ncbi:hypothetical protein VSR68_24905 [Paraburkholderia phymatum]|uniref:hypothetical protein n=1 Tax=Paraburkholderia phymatum TaxID=148447 RepID=UPI00317A6692